jgi:ribosomal protein L29
VPSPKRGIARRAERRDGRCEQVESKDLRFRNATGQLENTAEIGKVRKQVARINTLIRQREIAAAEAGQ